MGIGRHTPFALKSAIARAASPEELAEAGRELPSLVAALVAVGADPLDIARTTALVTDALTERLVAMAIEDLGDPPTPFAWLVLGGTARYERALTDHQHHALVFDGIGSDVDGYFAHVADRTTAGLQAAGIPPGEMMASLPDPSVDARRQAGGLDVETARERTVREVDREFLARIGRRALEPVPPTGFAGGQVVGPLDARTERLDVRATIAIGTDLARVWGLAAGTTTRETLGRLDAAVAADVLDTAVARALSDTLRFLWEVRLQHHSERIRAGLPPDDAVDPTALGAGERSGLKEAFRIVRLARQRLASDLEIASC
jgi:CBS domain-containing protein